MKIPVAIFTYNRPQHARQLFESLLKCRRLNECLAHIYCDGPKKPEHLPGIQAMRQVAYEFAPLLNNAAIVERNQNLGLARSIVSGVTELCDRYGRVIVLEDDFIVSPAFLNFMLQGLDKYANDERVAQIAGFLPPLHNNGPTDAFFLPLTTSCGWATWKRAWASFSWDSLSALSLLEADSQLRFRFDLDDSYPFSKILRSQSEGEVSSWAILWYWQTFHHQKLTLYPRHSLVWVGGFDEFATHTHSKKIHPFYNISIQAVLKQRWKPMVSFPNVVAVDEAYFARMKRFMRVCDSPSRVDKLVSRIKAKLKGQSLTQRINNKR